MATKKYVYYFGPDGADGSASMKNLLGGKGANIAEMCNLGIPVPAGFTISTEACVEYFSSGGKWPKGMADEVKKNLARLEKAMGKKFGDPSNPLLVSVRSGSRASMPGMMDTVLNLGLNDATIGGLIEKAGADRFAWDSYRRFITMFSDVVLNVERVKFERILDKRKEEAGVMADTGLGVDHLKKLVAEFKELVVKETGNPFPQDPAEQMNMSINAVFGSWHNKRAIEYRRLYNLPESWGTAVNIQAMVFGNMGENSGTGVAFTRDPSTGDRRFFGEFLFNAQGEDVVAGIRTPLSIEQMGDRIPQAKADLDRIYQKLEKHYRDMLDIEFTVENGKLYMLQNRVGKRTAEAAVRIAVEMAGERLITKEEAVMRVFPEQLDQLLHETIDPKAKLEVLSKGLPASPGAGVGRVVFTAEEAIEMAAKGEKVILVRQETSPEDIGGMNAAQGILTATGGMTSHAAVVARGMGKCCVAGAAAIKISEHAGLFTVGSVAVHRGDWITLDGSTGRVILGKAPLVKPTLSEDYKTLMKWADTFRKLKVRTNADTPHDAKTARGFGAEGIGLCRTEHMFFEGDRIISVREMILADTVEARHKALAKLLPMQKSDFIGIFEAMDGLPVTIRLLDPPLHEFLPKEEGDFAVLAKDLGLSMVDLKHRANSLHEFNPMLGHRGCRLGITFPEIYDMQTRAIFEAACDLGKRGMKVSPEIMIPLVAHVKELKILRERVKEVGEQVMEETGVKLKYTIGTMIELPRAAITADQIAPEADFFSFGTNDLTQTTFGLSRDDSGRFLPHYVIVGILPEDPFVSIDRDGVGAMIRLGVAKGRSVKPQLKVGICGEHGGDPSSVEFCHEVGFDYVSCSPYRVPIARLAAAQAAIKEAIEKKKSAKAPAKASAKPVAKKAAKKAVAQKPVVKKAVKANGKAKKGKR
ncbi:MAG: pyruvate, phosphate dikinase [Nitrospinae bacterium]|nr:pyruvate, phosphate dikinase [Nitrospinota bacterium]MBF0634201.1 pyruvate, phosphate dikinase [Nitrospinota bacterium]